MESNTCTDREGLDLVAGAAALARLVECVRSADRLIAEAVLLAGRLAGSGVAERVEGLPLEHCVGLSCRLTGADRRMLVAAGEALRDLPAVAGLFAQGELSWGQVRAVVAACAEARPDLTEPAERRRVERSFLARQMGLVRVCGEWLGGGPGGPGRCWWRMWTWAT